MSGLPRVVIIGGGFGGLAAARALRGEALRITLVDRRNHHLFQPLLYQVATAALNPSDIAEPIRRIFRRQRNVTVLMGEVLSIDPAGRKVLLADGELPFDHLIVAAGASHSYFGQDDFAPFAPGLKTLEDALEIRRRVLLAFEAAEREPDPDRRREWLTFVVVGGGPTGVELAGALAEIARHSLAKDFRSIDPTQARVLLLEGGPRILPAMDPALSDKAAAQLTRIGAEVRCGSRVTKIDDRTLRTTEGAIAARTTLWAAGVAASPLAKTLGVPLDRAGRVIVRPDLTIPGHDSIQVVGDLASIDQGGRSVPGLAPAAMQAGRHAARNVLRALRGQPRLPFRYADKGSLATIGRSSAVADFGSMRLSGWAAWIAWMAVHIFFLIGFRNRVLVMLQWAWVWFSWDRGARLITGPAAPPSGTIPRR